MSFTLRTVDSPPETQDLAGHSPDAHFTSVDAQGQPTARCSLWWKRVPFHAGHRVGLIGHFDARGRSPARALLEKACQVLAGERCTLAVGPMDGNTWRSYRLVTCGGDEPPFFLEPRHPPEWPAWFEEAGFTPLARYVSSITLDPGREDPRAREAGRRLEASGIRVRPIDPDRFDEDLRSIHSVCTGSFTRNLLYSPIDEAEFVEMHRPLLPRVRPEMVLLAKEESRPVGFIFCIPDWLQEARGGRIDTAIVKTLAVLPGRSRAGLGAVLLDRCHAVARALGHERVIHALMHDSNGSLNLSGRSARPMRRYTLFGRPLP